MLESSGFNRYDILYHSSPNPFIVSIILTPHRLNHHSSSNSYATSTDPMGLRKGKSPSIEFFARRDKPSPLRIIKRHGRASGRDEAPRKASTSTDESAPGHDVQKLTIMKRRERRSLDAPLPSGTENMQPRWDSSQSLERIQMAEKKAFRTMGAGSVLNVKKRRARRPLLANLLPIHTMDDPVVQDSEERSRLEDRDLF